MPLVCSAPTVATIVDCKSNTKLECLKKAQELQVIGNIFVVTEVSTLLIITLERCSIADICPQNATVFYALLTAPLTAATV